MSVPYLLRCPICLDVFSDPVALTTGQTYDRHCISRWLAGGHRICPVTMQPLHDAAVIPNLTLRHLVERWLAKNGDGREASLSGMKQCLLSDDVAGNAKIDALRSLKTVLVEESDAGKSRAEKMGLFAVVLRLAFQSSRAELVELALDCAARLAPPPLPAARDDGDAFGTIGVLLQQGTASVKANLYRLIELTPAATAAAARSQRAVHYLVAAVRGGGHHDAVRALAAVCAIDAASAVKGGAVYAVVKYLASAAKGRRTSAAAAGLAALESAVATAEGKKAFAKIGSGAVHAVVKHVFVVSDGDGGGGGEHAVGVLTEVCRESAKARADAVSAGVVSQLLLLLQSACGADAKGRARALLKLLSSM